MTGCPEYFLTTDIAKQYWCHFESIIRCRDNEELARLHVEEVKKRSPGGNFYVLPIVEKTFYVIPKLKSLVPLTSQKTASLSDDLEKINQVYPDETSIFFRLEPELFKKHFGEFKGPVRITYSDWRRLCGKKLHLCDAGKREEEEFSEKYPTVNAFWEWEGRYLTGIPDGLADEFVYVFMTVENYHILQYVKPVAMAEAWLYAFFLHRPRVRVQVRVRQANKIETFEQMSNSEKATKLLTKMNELLEGKIAPLPPDVNWKCKNCSFRLKCPSVSPA